MQDIIRRNLFFLKLNFSVTTFLKIFCRVKKRPVRDKKLQITSFRAIKNKSHVFSTSEKHSSHKSFIHYLFKKQAILSFQQSVQIRFHMISFNLILLMGRGSSKLNKKLVFERKKHLVHH